MRVPVASYRLQVNDDFTLDDAGAIVPYLAHLGVSDLYLSPIFEARPGSTHGYDVTDPTRIRASIGGMPALRQLARETQRHHMGILLDIVPNHMAASVDNPWWRDVLRHGQDSPYAPFFDIDWGTAESARRLRLPILDTSLDELIDRGDISVDASRGEVVYHETRLPLRQEGREARPAPLDQSPAPDVREVLDAQHYELVSWRSAATGMSYRRFFDIAELVGVRVEDPDVFEATHSLIIELAGAGLVTGLRVDHVDGLRDPAAYLRMLRTRVRAPDGEPVYTIVEKILERSESLPAEWECEGTTGYEFLSLAGGLLIAPDGHTAIDTFYRRVTGDVREFDDLVREKKHIVMQRLFGGELTALADSFADLPEARDVGLDGTLARTAVAELTASMQVYRTYMRERDVSDRDRQRIEQAAADALRRTSDPQLRNAIEMVRSVVVLGEAAGVSAAAGPERAFPTPAGSETGAELDAHLDWVMRWQQFTGPVMAKGFEDTALYCHNALLAANDVGSDPAKPCLNERELHTALQQRQLRSPTSLNATATHDTKRGEDTRARIAVLSEIPDEWRARLRRWIRQGDDWKSELSEDSETQTPAADVESLLYQTLLGAWPLHGVDDRFRERIKSYMTKAVREAKEQTSWRRPDEDYEQALNGFIEFLMAEFGREGLADDVAAFANRIAPHGALNGIAQMLLKVTAPGVPDIYQGTELWSHTLVDPDNRARVDFGARRRLFDDVSHLRDTPDAAAIHTLLESWRDGRIKLLMTALALQFRAAHREVFEHGDVVPLTAAGSAASHVFAFARRLGDRVCITALPRWTTALGDTTSIAPEAWGDTTVPLPPELRCSWHNALTGEVLPGADSLAVAALFRSVPFALLHISQPIGA